MKILHLVGLLFPVAAMAQFQQTVVVDDAHLQMGKGGTFYQVKSATALLLDATKYEFKVPAQLSGRALNSVQVVIAKDKQYSGVWPHDKKSLLLSAATLTPNPGSLPFEGFASGQQVVIAVGNMEGRDFNVVWVGMLNVK